MLLFGPPYCHCHNDSGFRFPPSWLRVTTSGAVKTCGDVTFSVAGSLYQRNIRRWHVKKYRVDPPDDVQQACSKHVEAYYGNTLIVNSAPSWFMLYGGMLQFMFCDKKIYESHVQRNVMSKLHAWNPTLNSPQNVGLWPKFQMSQKSLYCVALFLTL